MFILVCIGSLLWTVMSEGQPLELKINESETDLQKTDNTQTVGVGSSDEAFSPCAAYDYERADGLYNPVERPKKIIKR